MEFCQNCGSKLTEGHQFCAECGEPVRGIQSNEHAKRPTEVPVHTRENVSREQRETSSTPKQPIFKSKKSKIFTIISIVVIALLAGGYYVVKDMTSPTSVAEGFIEAIDNKDAGRVKAFINEGQYEEVTDKEVKAFLNYVHDHPQMMTSIAEGVLSEAEAIEAEKSTSFADEASTYATLKKDGKKWLLFDAFTVKIQTFYIEVATDIEKTDLFVNDEKKATIDDDKTIGPLLPGEYKIKAVINGEYGKVEDQLKVDTADLNDETESIQFDWNDFYVDVYSNYDDAILYVNDKSTDIEIGDIDELGPIQLDGKVKIHAQRKFGDDVKKTKAVTLKENTTNAELLFEEVEEFDDVDATGDAANIHATILQHYNSISNDDFLAAYDEFSSSYQSKVTFEGWTKGLKQNIKDEVTTLEISTIEGTTAKAYMEMTSYDEQDDGTTLVQEWGGTWNLVKESDGWKLEKAELEKLASRTES